MPRTPERPGGNAPERQHQSEKTAEALARLGEGIGEITDSEAFGDYLRTLSRFHEYSFGNALLIHTQRPDATRVEGEPAYLLRGFGVGHVSDVSQTEGEPLSEPPATERIDL